MRAFGEPVSYQLALYHELRECARDFFGGAWHGLPVQVRINPLVVASTGAGKTFLVHRLAEELDLPLFTATAGDWVLLCATARGAPPTLPMLYRFIQDNPRGIIFLDEFEKLGQGGDHGATDWRKFCQLEIFSVLDRRIIEAVLDEESGPKFLLSAEKLSERFRRSIYIICAGAWQSLWESRTDSIGFGESSDAPRLPTHADLAASLRLEILNRCSGRPLLLPPMTAKDYRSVFAEVFGRLPPDLQAVMQQPTEHQIQEAVRSKKGFRFVEELLGIAVRALRVAQEARKSAQEQTVENSNRVAEQTGITLSS